MDALRFFDEESLSIDVVSRNAEQLLPYLRQVKENTFKNIWVEQKECDTVNKVNGKTFYRQNNGDNPHGVEIELLFTQGLYSIIEDYIFFHEMGHVIYCHNLSINCEIHREKSKPELNLSIIKSLKEKRIDNEIVADNFALDRMSVLSCELIDYIKNHQLPAILIDYTIYGKKRCESILKKITELS